MYLPLRFWCVCSIPLRMIRRSFLNSMVGIASGGVLAGCGESDSSSDDSDSDLPSVEVTPESTAPENPTAWLEIRWRSRVQQTMSSPEYDRYGVPNEGKKWLVIQCEFTCNSGEVRLDSGRFKINGNPSVVADSGAYSLVHEQLMGGDTISRFLLYQVPIEREVVELNVDQKHRDPIAVEWQYDDALTIMAQRRD